MSRMNTEKGWKSKKVQLSLIINSTGKKTLMPSGIFPLIFQGPFTFSLSRQNQGTAISPHSPAPAISVSYHSVLNPTGDEPLVVLFSREGIMFHIFSNGPVQYFPVVHRFFFLTGRHVSRDNKSTNYFRLGKYTNSL